MIKKIIFLSTLFLAVAQAQVEISNKTNPEIDNQTDGLYVNFGDKGVLIPRVSLNSLTELKNSSGVNFPLQGDTSQLIVYNTNRGIGEGFHFWDGTKWRPLLDFENVLGQLNQAKVYYNVGETRDVPSTRSYPMSITSLPTYDYNSAININNSKTSYGVEFYSIAQQNITIDKTYTSTQISNFETAKVNFQLIGAVQIAEANPNISFAIGLYVDNQLKYIENYSQNFSSNNCNYLFFDFKGMVQGLTTGNHTISVAFHPRRSYNNSSNSTNYGYSFGKLNGSCTNLSSETMKPILTLTVKE